MILFYKVNYLITTHLFHLIPQSVFMEEDIWLRPAGVRGRDETSTRERERETSISHPSSSGACVTVGRSVSPSFVQVLVRLSEDLSWPAAAAAAV